MQTDQEKAWQKFESLLDQSPLFKQVTSKIYAGMPFFYLHTDRSVDREPVENTLKNCAATAMKGKRLTLAMSYVRKDQALYVYRVRFLVPQKKMFCCGNGCTDCIRLER
ncbi:hypothetical protein QRD89_08385 [Halobacillus sp. ACCC02827]|uniref:hypothetical protein n=1 Tax=Bacillaceae TaxID=186817 RepID=UPI0012670A09|nr:MULTISPECIES: hypothetical protein [Bacillaceae]QHT46539.1 hypothetical protein M662_08560 [Bacillus sp. SB49]WJE17351.1 hypothetical protein QRD89_08385 [Halobacillus sp. ACCC02827]